MSRTALRTSPLKRLSNARAKTCLPMRLMSNSTLAEEAKPLPSSPCTKYQAPTHIVSTPSAYTSEILDRSAKYILPVYARPQFALSHGKGSWVWDVDGNKYLDFSAGIAVNALGHADDGVVQVCMSRLICLLYVVLPMKQQFGCLWSLCLGLGAEIIVAIELRIDCRVPSTRSSLSKPVNCFTRATCTIMNGQANSLSSW
ncbi:acetylornithine aminotransferase [Pleurotus ostreatus]|nr:acetylornithine aminotransferase [Pleurotus ostreatus]